MSGPRSRLAPLLHFVHMSSPRSSASSEESLRALEYAQGPERGHRGRSYSISGFEFAENLLPLTASVSAPETLPGGDQHEKNIGLINGACSASRPRLKADLGAAGIALIVGLQVRDAAPRGLRCR